MIIDMVIRSLSHDVMRKLSVITICLLMIGGELSAQDVTAKTGKFFLDLTADIAPEITWVNPKAAVVAVQEKDIELKIGINSPSPIKSIDYFINNLPLSTRGFKIVEEEHNFDEMLVQNVILIEGRNTIKVVVEAENGKVSEEERIITIATGEFVAVMNRKDYALLFATDEYDYWKDLSNPVNDARTIARELEDKYDFNVELIENPSQDEVWIKLREYSAKSYLDHDQLFIFFAGHGQYDEVFNEGYLVTKDSKERDVAKSSYISYNRLRNTIDNIPSRHIFLTMDACFGGTFDPLISNLTRRGIEDAMYEEISQVEYLQRKLQYKTRKFLTSGGKEYVPDGRPGMHSPFARKFIEALKNYGGNDDVLTIQELKGYVEKINPEPRLGKFGADEENSDFVFVAGKE